MAAADIWVSHAECLLSVVLGNGQKKQVVYQCGLQLYVIVCTVTSYNQAIVLGVRSFELDPCNVTYPNR